MSDKELRDLERAARATPNDTAALAAFARAYLRIAEPFVVKVTPETLLRDLRGMGWSMDGIRAADVTATVLYATDSLGRQQGVRLVDIQATATVRDLAESVDHPSMLPGIGPTRARVLLSIVESAGLSFKKRSEPPVVA